MWLWRKDGSSYLSKSKTGFGDRDVPKRRLQAMDGVSGAGPCGTSNPVIESLELPAFRNRNISRKRAAFSGVRESTLPSSTNPPFPQRPGVHSSHTWNSAELHLAQPFPRLLYYNHIINISGRKEFYTCHPRISTLSIKTHPENHVSRLSKTY